MEKNVDNSYGSRNAAIHGDSSRTNFLFVVTKTIDGSIWRVQGRTHLELYQCSPSGLPSLFSSVFVRKIEVSSSAFNSVRFSCRITEKNIAPFRLREKFEWHLFYLRKKILEKLVIAACALEFDIHRLLLLYFSIGKVFYVHSIRERKETMYFYFYYDLKIYVICVCNEALR